MVIILTNDSRAAASQTKTNTYAAKDQSPCVHVSHYRVNTKLLLATVFLLVSSKTIRP